MMATSQNHALLRVHGVLLQSGTLCLCERVLRSDERWRVVETLCCCCVIFAFLRASFASIFWGLGVPVFCYLALRYHNVPRMAKEKQVCSEFLISEHIFGFEDTAPSSELDITIT